MKLDRKLLVLAAAASLCACNGTTSGSSAGNMVVTSDVASLNNDGSLAHITVTVVDGGGHPATGSVTVSASGGNLDGSGLSSVNKTLDAAGKAAVSYACDFTLDTTHCGAGNITVTAVWSSVANGTRVTLIGPSAPPPSDGGSPPPPVDAGPILGGPLGPPSSIMETAMFPDVLGLKGSGIQENGVMTFLVTDSTGRAVPNVAVNFSQRQPALVTLGRTLSVSNANGQAFVDYTAGTEVGVSAIIATVPATGATSSHAVAVRGAKPSAAGFYFRCEKGNLPAYQTTPALETMTCEVRLSDRYGNRVGVPTPVRFATEAGAVDSIAVTKGFDPSNPNDPAEGTATVTFTTDMGNGFRPADVVPLATAPAQYPWPRQAEPQIASGSLTRNPRDNLVTIIAMADGEEAFIDSNHNGTLDNNEVFFDLGDPFIDANDDGLYDQIYPNGPWELRFCSNTTGTNCSTYTGPNGQWDSSTTIWVPTWVVFSDNAAPFTVPAGQPQPPPPPPPTISYSPACVAEKSSSFADIYVYDEYLNSPPAGTTYSDAKVDRGTSITAVKHGFFDEMDNWGAMGKFGLDFDYWPVLPSGGACAAPASPTAPTACVLRLLFRSFDPGFRGTLEAVNGNATSGTCGAPATFQTSIGVVNVKGATFHGGQVGQNAP